MNKKNNNSNDNKCNDLTETKNHGKPGLQYSELRSSTSRVQKTMPPETCRCVLYIIKLGSIMSPTYMPSYCCLERHRKKWWRIRDTHEYCSIFFSFLAEEMHEAKHRGDLGNTVDSQKCRLGLYKSAGSAFSTGAPPRLKTDRSKSCAAVPIPSLAWVGNLLQLQDEMYVHKQTKQTNITLRPIMA